MRNVVLLTEPGCVSLDAIAIAEKCDCRMNCFVHLLKRPAFHCRRRKSSKGLRWALSRTENAATCWQYHRICHTDILIGSNIPERVIL